MKTRNWKCRRSKSPQLCGFCGSRSGCTTTLEKGAGNQTRVAASDCKARYMKLSIGAATNNKSKCRNVPVKCEFCDPEKWFWSYGYLSHLQNAHSSQVSLDNSELVTKYALPEKELDDVLNVIYNGKIAKLQRQNLKTQLKTHLSDMEDEGKPISKFWVHFMSSN